MPFSKRSIFAISFLTVLAFMVNLAMVFPQALAQWNDKCPPDCDNTSSSSTSSSSGSSTSSSSTSSSSSGIEWPPQGEPEGISGFKTTESDIFHSDKPRADNYIPETIIKGGMSGERGKEANAFVQQYYDKTKKDGHPWNPYNKDSMKMWKEDGYHVLHDYTGTGILDPDAQLFHECLDAKLVEETCPSCQPKALPFYVDTKCTVPFVNIGSVVDYWWPTTQIEINNFGISSVNPADKEPIQDDKYLYSDKMPGVTIRKIPASQALEQYAREKLVAELQQLKNKYWEMTRDSLKKDYNIDAPVADPIPGYTPMGASYHSGDNPTDEGQNLSGEAHTSLTELQTTRSWIRNQGWGRRDFLYRRAYGMCIPWFRFHYNGYSKGNHESCFFDTLEPDVDVTKEWTEYKYYRPFWLYPNCSVHMNGTGGLFEGSRPKLSDVMDPSGNWVFNESCASYRNFSHNRERMTELHKEPMKFKGHYAKQLWSNCYQGGWQLYPLVGADFSQSAITGPGILIRRGAELAGQRGNCALTSETTNKCGHYPNATSSIRDHVNRFTRLSSPPFETENDPKRTEIDKIQILFPRVFDKKGEWVVNKNKKFSEGTDYPSKCMRMHELEELSHGGETSNKKGNPADILLAKHKGSVRYVVWEKRRACFCPFRGIEASRERKNGRDYWTDPVICAMGMNGCQEQGWGCMNYPEGNMDLGRGNLAEEAPTRYKGSGDFVPWYCYYPYKFFRSPETDKINYSNVDHTPGTYDYKGVINNACAPAATSGLLMDRPSRDYREVCEKPKCTKLDKSKSMCEPE